MAQSTNVQRKEELLTLARNLHKLSDKIEALAAILGTPATPAKKKAAPKKRAKRTPAKKKVAAKKKAAPKTAKTTPRNRVLGTVKRKKSGAKVADLPKSLKMNLKSVQNALHRLKQ
ncbi:hypothetical protein [uncultured Desulfosarcina sp.]|uniref:hypothetical protein n=1 Tax=uncultured Desulfosarcina sp. TaxID=218289 RepID=UPI0029C6C68B|nr:hypothetical protein [uncultured Desulfosarcina sp.]